MQVTKANVEILKEGMEVEVEGEKKIFLKRGINKNQLYFKSTDKKKVGKFFVDLDLRTPLIVIKG